MRILDIYGGWGRRFGLGYSLFSSAEWWIRTAGSNLNGGGFDSTVASPGTNYANQNAAQYSGTNLTTDPSDASKVVPEGHTPTSADPGNIIQIQAGGNWVAGYYKIVDQDGINWILDRPPVPTSASSGTWAMGGAFGNIIALSFVLPTVTTPLYPGNIIHIIGSDDSATVYPEVYWTTPAFRLAADTSGGGAVITRKTMRSDPPLPVIVW